MTAMGHGVADISTVAKSLGKRLVFPGVDMHARSRFRHLPQFFTPGPVRTLDAGCGNGMLSYAAYRMGNEVLGVTFDAGEVVRNTRFYAAIGADPSRLAFRHLNLYDLPELGKSAFDQIICTEALEHVRDDRQVVEHFAAALRPGGVLHLCSPNALHPYNALGRTDEPEDGRHVRDGYTIESYRSLLEPAGFRIDFSHGVATPAVVEADRLMWQARTRLGSAAAVPLLVALSPVRFLDRLDPAVPFSIYVRASRL